MITLTFAVIANFFFGADLEPVRLRRDQRDPGAAERDRQRRTRTRTGSTTPRSWSRSSSTSLIRYLVRTPFGIALQGDPRRPGADELARLQRARCTGRWRSASPAFIAALGGVLFVWWNGHIDPASINIGAAIDLLVDLRDRRSLPARGRVGRGARVRRDPELRATTRTLPLVGGTFHTLIGAIFLLIVLVSPGGSDRDLGTGSLASSARRPHGRRRGRVTRRVPRRRR